MLAVLDVARDRRPHQLRRQRSRETGLKLVELGFREVVGVEPSSAPIAAAPSSVRGLIRQGLFPAGEFAPGHFSLISCFQTLEHVAEPRALLESVRRLLQPRGAFVTVCHDHSAFVNRVLSTRSPIFDIEHLQLFSPRSLKKTLKAAGFEGVQVFALRNRYPFSYWLRLMPLPAKAKTALYALSTRIGLAGVPIELPVGNMMAIGFQPA